MVGRSATLIYLHLVKAQEAHEPVPSISELAEATGLSRSVVHIHIHNLRTNGLLPPAEPGAGGVNRPTLRVVANSPREIRPTH
jgi:DNA-binding IscR family transcriptional regulator